MNTAEVLKIFSDPALIQTLSRGDLTVGILVTMFLGMGVTFLVLTLLQFVIMGMSRLIPAEAASGKLPVKDDGTDKKPGFSMEDELVAVLTSAVAAAMRKPAGDIAIKNVREIK